MSDLVSEVKSRLDIVDVVSKYVKLTRSGSRFRAVCPFHDESTPSFYVSPDLQIFKCFGCGEGGDIFTFIEKIERVEFSEALKMLSEDAGVDVSKHSKGFKSKESYDLKKRIYDVNSAAVRLFERFLWESKDDRPRKYLLEDRKISEEILKKFNVGACPEEQNFLTQKLLQLGFSQKEIISSGFGFPSNYSKFGVVDRFKGRIVVPIRDDRGRAVGVTSRIVEGFTNPEQIVKSGKYVNSTESPVFKKSDVLFGFSESKDVIKEKNEVILVEGQFDVISANQHGITNVVCSSGTAISEKQIKKLTRFADKIVIIFDNDEAGAKARFRVAQMSKDLNFDFFAVITEEKDLDEFLTSDGQFSDLERKGLVEVVLREIFTEGTFSSGAERERILERIEVLVPAESIMKRNKFFELVSKFLREKWNENIGKTELENRFIGQIDSVRKLDKKAKSGSNGVHQNVSELVGRVFLLRKRSELSELIEILGNLSVGTLINNRTQERLLFLMEEGNDLDSFWEMVDREEGYEIKDVIFQLEEACRTGKDLVESTKIFLKNYLNIKILELGSDLEKVLEAESIKKLANL